MASCSFDMLFTKSVPHILENIFFSLDFASYKSCLEVNTMWNCLLMSDSYQSTAKSLFHNDIRRDEKKLWDATREGNAEGVREIVSQKMVNVNTLLGCRHSTPLCEAAGSGHKEVVLLLLDSGAEPDKGDLFDVTALLRAAKHGHTNVVKLLMDKGADPNAGDKYGWTPLNYAAMNGQTSVVKLLIDRGADPNKPTVHPRMPLHWATQNGHEDVVQLLLDAGADHDKTDDSGRTPLDVALHYGHKRIIRILDPKRGQRKSCKCIIL